MKAFNVSTAKALLTLCFFISSLVCVAQTSETKHIVARGETLNEIATKYNTTVQEIISKNPHAAEFIYVGMELVIPTTIQKETSSNSSDIQPNSTTVQKTITPQSTLSNETIGLSNTDKQASLEEGFTMLRAFYHSSFKKAFSSEASYDYYGLSLFGLPPYGSPVALIVQFGINYGLKHNVYDEKDRKNKPWGLTMNFGAGYVHRFNEKMYAFLPLTLDICSTTVSYKRSGGGSLSPINKTFWGFSLIPEIGYEIAPKLWLSMGLSLDYYFPRNVKIDDEKIKIKNKVLPGFQLNIGYAF